MSNLIKAMLAVFLVVVLTGCGSLDTEDNAGPVDTGAATAAGDDVSAAAEPGKLPDTLAAPISSAVDLRGKKVLFIPFGLKVAYFEIMAKGFADGLSTLGATVQNCDGQFTPSGVAQCIDQALGADVDAVVTAAVSYEMASTSFNRLVDAGIPTLLYSINEPDGDYPGDLVVRDAGWLRDPAAQLSAKAVIADSGGAANVLYLQLVDSPSLRRFGEAAIDTIKKECKGCSVDVKTITSPTLDQLPSVVSGALLDDPDIDYVIPQTDALLQGTMSGLRSVNSGGEVKVATTSGSLGGLQLVKSDDAVLVDVGFSADYFGWTMADSLVRMLTGDDVPTTYPPVIRVFDKSNIGGIDLTPASEKSGEWYGPTDYRNEFPTLWAGR